MSGPWEAYAQPEAPASGPWERYAVDGDVSRETGKKEVPDVVRPFVAINRDIIAGGLGAPVDAATWGINKVSGAVGGPPDLIKNPVGGSESIKKAMGALPFGGANPDDVRPAETTGEKVLEGAGTAAGAMLIPGLGAEALLARSLKQTETFGTQLAKLLAGSGAASNTAIGAAGGALGEVAAESVPADASLSVGPVDFSAPALKDAARLGGNLAGGGLAAGVISSLETGGRAVGGAVRAATEDPKIRAARQMLARSEDPAALPYVAERVAEAPPLVPGSNPTTFQATGDLGLGGLERSLSVTRRPTSPWEDGNTPRAPDPETRFAHSRAAQNSARLAELDKLQKALPENADPAAAASYVQKRVQELEQTFGERVTAARNQLDDAFKAGQLNEAEYGVALREAPIRLRTELEKTEDALWAAVDPDRVAPFNPTNLKEGVLTIEAGIPRTAKAAEGEERALFDVFKGLDESTTFGDITALRSRLTDELRESTNTPTVRRRISMMLGEVDKALAESGASAPDVLERYAAARASTRDVKTRFGEGALGEVLKEGKTDGFKVTASNVAKKIFDKPEALRTYLNAVGDDAAAQAALQDYAAFSLRGAAMKDGRLDLKSYREWMADHEYALQEFPGLRQKFSDIASAQVAIDDALAAQKQALTDYQTQTIKSLLKTEDPDRVITKALSTPGEFTILAKEVANDPAAKAGMKRAVVDFMLRQARSTAESGTSGEAQINAATLQKFFLNNKRSLGALFSPEEMASMERVTMDLQRANRSNVAVKIPGPGTAQDMPGSLKSVLGHLMRNFGAVGGGGAGSVFGAPGMVAGAAAGAVADAMRVARVNSIESALVEMMIDPKMAAEWLRQVPAKDGAATASAFARRLKALTAAQVTQAFDEESGRQ